MSELWLNKLKNETGTATITVTDILHKLATIAQGGTGKTSWANNSVVAATATNTLGVVTASVTVTRYLASEAGGLLFKALVIGDMFYSASRYSVVAGSRDLTAGAGDVAYTGAGFKPTAIILLAAEAGAAEWSIGIAKGTTENCLYAPAGGGVTIAPGYIATAYETTYQQAIVKSMDADGCTLTWSKSGTPSGTFVLYFLYLR